MATPDQLHQSNVRIQQATQNTNRVSGGLGAVLSGDNLQLPPIERGSLAKSLVPSMPTHESHAHGDDDKPAGSAQTESGESAQGFLLWRSFTRVISLSVNVRAPGPLGQLQEEMRAGRISDLMWRLYLSRIVQPQDPRLLKPPF